MSCRAGGEYFVAEYKLKVNSEFELQLLQDSRTFVDTVVPGFAADLSGRFYEGVEVTGIDGVDVSTFSLNAIKRLTIGDEGTSVRLDMRREGFGPYSVTLTRRQPSFRDGRNQDAANQIVSDW